MDGGGSTTMAWLDPSSGTAQLLNVPRNSDGFGSPPSAQERYIGNNIGVTYVARPGKFGQEN